ncbi:hypothetical protein ACFYKX_07460 [Cytobacillus sp. FJAT-54145]|uniref:Uncharacterized protein n=1 Tax=Cytobacillus spartinae TaxID=3299023 RepID=A0ABW6KB27_9BACI
MGYIAPVTHYQYQQYAERDIKKDYDPFHFVPINKINPALNEQLASQAQYKANLEKPIKRKLALNQRAKTINDKTIEHTYSELTGKGKYFSECI